MALFTEIKARVYDIQVQIAQLEQAKIDEVRDEISNFIALYEVIAFLAFIVGYPVFYWISRDITINEISSYLTVASLVSVIPSFISSRIVTVIQGVYLYCQEVVTS